MQINLLELWHSMGLPVRGVVVLLSFQAVACVAVVLDRLILLSLSAGRARAFAGSVQSAMEASDYDQVLVRAGESKPNHLTSYMELGVRTFVGRRAAGDEIERAAEFTRRALERKGDAISRDMNRGMNILAS